MKTTTKLLGLLALAPSLAQAAAFQVRIEQKNAADTVWGITVLANPPANETGFFTMDGATRQLRWVVPTTGLHYDPVARTLAATAAQSDWSLSSGAGSILNKPVLSPVATSGAYSDLTGTPSIPAAQVQTDWNAVSGIGVLLNKPALSTVATTGAYSDLSGLPSLFDGTWGSLTGKPSTFTPSAHTHDASDIVSGTLSDSRIPSLAISKTTGLQAALDGKFPNPAGTTSQYVRGDGSLATLPVDVFVAGSPTTRSVSLATAYQCTTTTRPCMVTITLQAQSSISLSGATNNEGQIVIGSTNAVASGTGTAIATYKNNLGGTLVIGLNLNSQQANTYSVLIPTGWYWAARQTSGYGLQVVSAFDQSMGN